MLNYKQIHKGFGQIVERAYNLHTPLIFDVNDEYPPVSCSFEIFLTISFAVRPGPT